MPICLKIVGWGVKSYLGDDEMIFDGTRLIGEDGIGGHEASWIHLKDCPKEMASRSDQQARLHRDPNNLSHLPLWSRVVSSNNSLAAASIMGSPNSTLVKKDGDNKG